MDKSFSAFLSDSSGATAIEYALIAGGIAVTIIVAVNNLGGAVSNQYNNIANAVH